MDKRIHKKDKNVIFYPGLVKRLIEKGMDALKDKDGQLAYQHFLSAENHEPDHPQVLFGKMLSLVELGRLSEAVEHTTQLLHEDIGDYYDNLQVHISLLVQLEQYEKVVDIIDAVLVEKRIPSQYAESFYQLLHFSRQMVEGQTQLVEPETNLEQVDEIIHMLQEDSLEMQLNAIFQLKSIEHAEATKALVTYIEGTNRDLALQSMALQVLHEKKFNEPIHIEKQGRQMDVIPSQLEDIDQLTFGHAIVHRLDAELGHENPLLFDIAKQLCSVYLLALYPFLPEPEDEKLWAAVFHYCATERLGLEDGVGGIEARYQLAGGNLINKKIEVEMLEATIFQIDQFKQ